MTKLEKPVSRETLILVYHTGEDVWLLRDTSGNHISTMRFRSDAEKYAKEMGYRLQIKIGDKIEWYN